MRIFYFYEVDKNKNLEEMNPNDYRSFLRKLKEWFLEFKKDEKISLVISQYGHYFFLVYENIYFVVDDRLDFLDWNIKNISKEYINFLEYFKIKNLIGKNIDVLYIQREGSKELYTEFKSIVLSYQ